MKMRKSLRDRNKKVRLLYPLFWGGMLLLWALLVILLIQFWLEGESFLQEVLEKYRLIQFVPAASVRTMAETVGFGSILLVWVYSILDKQELGLRYSVLLQSLYPAYFYFVVSHFLAMLLCVGLSGMPMIDGALLALLIVIGGGILQGKALSILVFNSEKRRWAAANVWEKRLCMHPVDGWYYHELCSAAAVINLERDDAVQRILRYFYQGLCRYITAVWPKNSGADKQIQCVLLNLAHIWEEVLRARTDNERLALAQDILCCSQPGYNPGEPTAALDMGDQQKPSKQPLLIWKLRQPLRKFAAWLRGKSRKEKKTAEDPAREDTYLDTICLGYVIAIFRLYSAENPPATEEEVLLWLKRHLQLVCYRCGSEEVTRCLSISVRLLAGIGMYCSWYAFNSDLFEKRGECEKDGDKEALYAMVQILFQESAVDGLFELVYPQLFKGKSARVTAGEISV